ncbi:MAG: IS1182 family transposase [Planctomycetota bacterium]|jgi:transposase
MVFFKDEKKQNWLIPPNIKDMIDDDHICHIVDAVIDSMDFTEIEKKQEGPGHPGYHPKIILKIIIMGMIDSIRTSRKLKKNAKENVVYMYLAGKSKPDFRTISDFRKNNPELVESCFKAVVEYAKKLGMVHLGHISIDGTKIKANASNERALTKDELKFLDKIIRTEIQKGIEADELEDEIYGEDKDGYELPDEVKASGNIKKYLKDKLKEQEIKSKHERRMEVIIKEHIDGDGKKKKQINKKIEDALEEIENSDAKTANLTDPDSKFMMNKKGRIEQAYNGQIAVDSKHKIILATNISQAPDDINELQPMIERIENSVGELPEGTEISLDNGYYSGPNLKYLEDKELNGYVPDGKLAQKRKGNSVKKIPFGKEDFEYDDENDVFICPNNEKLVLGKEYYEKKRKRIRQEYHGETCSECPDKELCVKQSKITNKIIYADKYEKYRKRMADKMECKEANEKLGLRSRIVEHPFGDIKYNMGLSEFLTRGLNKVKTEFNLGSIAHNIKKIASFIKDNNVSIKSFIQTVNG